MERCHARDEERRGRARAEAGRWRDVDALLAAGERVAALRIARAVGDGTSGAARARATIADLTNRLVQGRAVTLRTARGVTVRVAAAPALAPAILGRDPQAEIPLRDPGVSRRHAQLSITSDECVLTDLGSRLGTFVGAARLEREWPLGADTEVSLGPSCRLRLQSSAPDLLILRGEGGLDGGTLAIDSEEGVGTTVRVTFPLVANKRAAA